jgi:hypothetical protein
VTSRIVVLFLQMLDFARDVRVEQKIAVDDGAEKRKHHGSQRDHAAQADQPPYVRAIVEQVAQKKTQKLCVCVHCRYSGLWVVRSRTGRPRRGHVSR